MSVLFRTLAATTFGLIAALVTSASAQASVIYTYTGSNFDSVSNVDSPADPFTTNDRVTGVVELAAPLAADLPFGAVFPVSFSFSDGVSTITNATVTTPPALLFATNSAGDITSWVVTLIQQDPLITRMIVTAGGPAVANVDQGLRAEGQTVQLATIYDSPGVWRQKSDVPEPASLLLVGAAVAGLVARRRAR